MDIWMMVIMLACLGLTMAVSAATPQMSRPTVPLGVNVPSDRVNDPAVRGAVRRYRIWVLVGGLVAAAGMVAAWKLPELSVLILLGYVGWTVFAFAVCRQPIMTAKAQQGWYDEVSVQTSPSVTPGQPAKPLWPVLIFAVGISLATVIVMAISYSNLPDPLPVQHDAEGDVTNWEPKSWVSALLLPLLSLGSTLVMVMVCVILTRRQQTHFPDGRPRAAQEFQHARAVSLQRALAALTLASAILMSVVAFAPVIELEPSRISWAIWALTAASSLPIIWLIIDSIRHHRAQTAAPEESGPQSPDDDHLWRWGIFYENRQDPRVWVEKRNGIGLTVNIGHPGGMVFMGVVALLVLATIALVITVLTQ